MIKVIYPTLLCILLSTIAQAQRSIENPLINSKEVIATGVALHDKGKYKEAINQYLKVPASDTAYSDVIYELILSYYNDSNYNVAEKYIKEAQKLFPERNTDWYSLLANVYDDTKRSDLALATYDSILQLDTHSYSTYFNKGITLMRLSRLDEAETCFQKCIVLNPYYASAHHFLGRLALFKGNLTQAMMSFATNLLVAPGNRYLKTSVDYLSSISEVNNSVVKWMQQYKASREDDFDLTQEIISSKISLDKKYKLKTDLEDNIVRQLQVMMEKLEYNANDKGFWMQYYVPLFKQVWDQDQFEPFIYYLFSELDIKKVKEYVKKDNKKIENVTSTAVDYLNLIRESQQIDFTKREKAAPRYYIQNYKISGKGDYSNNSKGEKTLTGSWEFYFASSKLKSKGVFDAGGLRQGEWTYYYENGTVSEISIFKDDRLNGKSEIWFDNGIPYKKSTYIADEKEGEETTWFYNGKLNSVINYKAGKKNGLAKYYTVDGYLKTIASFQDNMEVGDEITYYENGAKETVSKYSNDQAIGVYSEYYDNGKLKKTGEFIEGKKNGLWKELYEDGTQESSENYIKGELDGENISWYDNGKIETKKNYRKGEVDGKLEYYDDDGIILEEAIFEKGRLKDIMFFDKKGNVISNTTSRKGSATISFYSPDGAKLSEGFYSKEGLLEGKSTSFYNNGTISTDANYKNGVLEGKRIQYYENGKIKQEGNYTAGEADGYFIDYYENGEVMEEGWYVKDKREGTVISRNLLGQINNKIYYLNNNVHGIADYYYPTGKLDFKTYSDNGWINKVEQFDSSGQLISNSTLTKGDGVIRFSHFNGKLFSESYYKSYKKNGALNVFNGDGSKSSIGFYKNGEPDSLYKSWYPDGKIAQEGLYIDGKKSGVWKAYGLNGQQSSLEIYKDGKQVGKNFQYNEDGSIDKEINYENGEINGEIKNYADKEIALVQYYKKGKITGYSYEDQTGKLVPVIPLVKGTGKVTAYFKNGTKSVEMEYKEYQVDGNRICYHPNGKEYITIKRLNGLEDGVKKIFYPSGKIMKEENYVYGNLHGHVKWYDENGNLISDLNYYLGTLNGESKYYTAGKLTATYYYYYGSLESKK